jgi:hypothetical protein
MSPLETVGMEVSEEPPALAGSSDLTQINHDQLNSYNTIGYKRQAKGEALVRTVSKGVSTVVSSLGETEK